MNTHAKNIPTITAPDGSVHELLVPIILSYMPCGLSETTAIIPADNAAALQGQQGEWVINAGQPINSKLVGLAFVTGNSGSVVSLLIRPIPPKPKPITPIKPKTRARKPKTKTPAQQPLAANRYRTIDDA